MGRHALPVAALLAVAVGLGCGRRNCVPDDLAAARPWVDLSLAPGEHAPVDRTARLQQVAAEFRRQAVDHHPPGSRPYHVLALSGGGLYGSFGVGVLNGWTESGARPPFDVVTGISAGALVATFAFLGPQYDELIRREGVGVGLNDIARRRSVLRLPVADALYSSAPLARKIEATITPEVLCEVARGHAAGRRLYVGTTNLDTRRLVIWDMGAIAARGTPEALDLYRQVVLASSSVPGAFPPVRLPVEVDGTWYEELHVDGGASDGVIFRPFMVTDLNRLRGVPGAAAPPGSTLYVVNNGKLYAEPSCVRPRIVPQLSASFRSLQYGKGRDELYRIYLNCLETAVEFRLTAIPQDFRTESAGGLQLERSDQERLWATGREFGRAPGVGPGWRDLPPGTDATEQAMPRAGVRFLSGGRPAGP